MLTSVRCFQRWVTVLCLEDSSEQCEGATGNVTHVPFFRMDLHARSCLPAARHAASHPRAEPGWKARGGSSEDELPRHPQQSHQSGQGLRQLSLRVASVGWSDSTWPLPIGM